MAVVGPSSETAAASDPRVLLQPYDTDCAGVASDLLPSTPLKGFLRTQSCIKTSLMP